MKSEERHQLEKNDLAEWVLQTYESLRPNWPYILGGIVVFAAALWFVNHRRSSQELQLRAAWNDYFTAESGRNVEALRSLVDRYPDSPVAPLAQKRVADFRFADGKKMLLTDRGEAMRLLDDAANIYQELLADVSISLMLRRQAELGLALTQETTGALTKARETYKKISQSFPGTDEATRAEERLKHIESPEAEKFYDQLAAFKPPQPTTDLPQPTGGLPPMPPAPTSSPDSPLINLPGPDEVSTPPPPPSKPDAAKAKADQKPKTVTDGAKKATPKAPAPKAADSATKPAPAAKKSAAKKSAAEAKPATDKQPKGATAKPKSEVAKPALPAKAPR